MTINGTNFVTGATLTIGGVAATNISVANDTTITATTPAHAADATDVAVTTPGGNGVLTGGFSYLATPNITDVNPASGPTAGSTSATITGANFVPSSTVSIGGAAALSVTFVDATSLTAMTPAHAPGAADIVVTTPGGSGTLTNGFSFIGPPDIVSISPISGTTSGGWTSSPPESMPLVDATRRSTNPSPGVSHARISNSA